MDNTHTHTHTHTHTLHIRTTGRAGDAVRNSLERAEGTMGLFFIYFIFMFFSKGG